MTPVHLPGVMSPASCRRSMETQRHQGPDDVERSLLMRYEIRVDGQMSDTLTAAFPELDSFVAPRQTVLFGEVTDEAHLFGLLARFQSLGLHVVEMRRLPA
ncbi:hypothetical protein GCM10010276_06390 [Streptomyces longisporus]|uniref:Uncharacterized protein n=2 Tax=Streptomyces longisporus TaxID=1948 RepID=A0ABN3KXN0_STRLO